MKYDPKQEVPSLAEVIRKIYALCARKDDLTAYGYLQAVNKELFSQDMKNSQYTGNINAVRTLVDKLQKFDRPSKMLSSEDLKLEPFTDWNMKYVDAWFNGETKKMRESTLYPSSGFYAFGLLRMADCKAYIQYFFEALGIEENASLLYDRAAMLNWDADLVLFATYLLLGCSKGDPWLANKFALFAEWIDSKQYAVSAADFAEKSWLADVSLFRPRSIEKAGILSMQDFYVRPDFETQGNPCPEPMKRLSGANTSVRSLIVSQTGMGKSMYMRMTALCLARELLEADHRIAGLSNALGLPDDMYVIYIPAYMFSYCYQKQEYKGWTDDFVKLYFNCMFRLSCAINFDKHEARDRRITPEADGYAMDDRLLHYISLLAQNGKLILLADSFDEIVSGPMRQAYLQALQAFRETYCNYPEAVGAHIFMTSRDMSQSTMEALASSMAVTLSSANVYRIKPLSAPQQKELILNWDRAFGNGIRDNINELGNHYFVALCSNPYMLSFICNMSGEKINFVTEKLISSILYYRTKTAAGMLEDDDLLRSVLESRQIKEILQDLALETVELSSPHFSLDLLAKHCMARFADLELSEAEFDRCYDRMIGLFTTSVGLIVPADHEDDRFQFISDQIRYELAASKISGRAFKCGSDAAAIQSCITFLQGLKNDEAYTSLIVPLICKTKSISLAENLILHLALRTFAPDCEGLAIQAMIDLVLGRYGLNITCSAPTINDSAYGHYVNADRLIMMRLLSSPAFHPTPSEKQGILQSNALKVCDGFLNDDQIKRLQ